MPLSLMIPASISLSPFNLISYNAFNYLLFQLLTSIVRAYYRRSRRFIILERLMHFKIFLFGVEQFCFFSFFHEKLSEIFDLLHSVLCLSSSVWQKVKIFKQWNIKIQFSHQNTPVFVTLSNYSFACKTSLYPRANIHGGHMCSATTLLGAPAQSNAVHYSSSTIKSAFIKLILGPLD